MTDEPTIRDVLNRLDTIDGRLDTIDGRLDTIDGRLDKLTDAVENHLPSKLDEHADGLLKAINTFRDHKH